MKAALKSFPKDEHTLVAQATFDDIFQAVQSGAASHGIVPFENSSNGAVIQTLDLLGKDQGRYEDLLIEDEVYFPVEHYLLGHAPPQSPVNDEGDQSLAQDGRSGVPFYDLSYLAKISSHPQALGQCSTFLNKYCKHVELAETSSTSKAAKDVLADTSGKTAAVASQLCAELTGLTVLAKGVQKDSNNVTRFFILRRKPQHSDQGKPPEEKASEAASEQYRTLVVFTVSHREPGALANALAVFKKHDINLTGMHTRPSGEGMWQYLFFVEFEGRRMGESGDGTVDGALAELERVLSRMRWLGSWKDQGGRS